MQSKFSLLLDIIESTTTYHREPRDVKIKVGWIRLLGLFITLALVGVMGYTIATTNMHLEEEVPVGQFSHWAGGSGAVSAKANEQWVNSSLCKYDKMYDYFYGMDNEWDYSAAVCERGSLGENAFKSASSMHFVTFESQRMDVLLPKEGSSCDEECQTVYPEWPGADSYGEDDYRSVHVATQFHAAMQRQNSELKKVKNVHMMRPQSSGPDRCQCYSFQNIFKLGMDAARLVFTYSYSTQHIKGSSKSTGDMDPMNLLFADGAIEPFDVIEKGKSVSFELEQVLTALNTCLDCQPEADFWTNSICPNKTCSPPYQAKPVPRTSGMMIDVRTEFYSHQLTMPQGPLYDWVKANHEPPYAIHKFSKYEDWASRGSDTTLIEDSPQRKVTIDRYRYGVLIRIKPAAGVISRPNPAVVVNNLCNFTVLMGYPGMIMSVVVFTLMGRRSKLFRKSQRVTLTVPDMYRSWAFSAMVAKRSFDVLDEHGNGYIDREDLRKHVSSILMPGMQKQFPDKPEVWYHNQISGFVDEMIDGFNSEGEKPREHQSGITYERFIRHATSNCALDWDDITTKIATCNPDDGSTCRRRKKSNAVACAPEPFQASKIVPNPTGDTQSQLEHANELLRTLQDTWRKSADERAQQIQALKDGYDVEAAKVREEVQVLHTEIADVTKTLNSLVKGKEGSGEPEDLS